MHNGIKKFNTMKGVHPQIKCRICRSDKLVEFLNLGMQPLANSFLPNIAAADHELMYPLRVMFCQLCNLCQLGEVVDPEILFRDYVYFSSGMPSSPHYTAYADEVVRRFITGSNDMVVEIGSNDGHLLAEIQKKGVSVLGVDPARNIATQASARGIETLPEFFSEQLAHQICKHRGSAQVIIGNNVVAHIDDHHDLVRGVAALLSDRGVFIFEAPYLVDMFENLTFDTVYHEHLSYLAVRPLQKLFEQFGMEIFDAQIFPVQGNSLRVYACKKGAYGVEPSVAVLAQKEIDLGLSMFSSYQKLGQRIEELRNDVRQVVVRFKQEGKKIACYGAPAKGNTLLNYFGLGADIFSFATEELPSKIGLLTPGMHVPVVHIADARKNPSDYYLLLAWNYKDVIFQKEKEFHDNGGKFIMPVGSVRIL